MRSIVIVGAGAAGLSLAYYLSMFNRSSEFACTLLETDTKRENDRTWAFWGDEFDFDYLVRKRWDYVDVLNTRRRVRRESAGYRYIPADRFYRACLDRIERDSRFTFIRARAERIESNHDTATVVYRAFEPHDSGVGSAYRSPDRSARTITADFVVDTVFGSGLRVSAEAVDRERVHFRQSFVGWEVETGAQVWDDGVATLMDFSDRDSGHALEFHYVLPERPDRALVEYTTVDRSVPDEDYLESALERYLDAAAGRGQWTICRREKGTIPLFERTRPCVDGRIVYLGVASGAARPSTGYAFRAIVEQARGIAEMLVDHRRSEDRLPKLRHTRPRPRFFDRVFMELLRGEPSVMPGALVSLFEGNTGSRVFRFLAGQSSLKDELRIIWALPWPPFLRALGRRIIFRFKGISRASRAVTSRAQHAT